MLKYLSCYLLILAGLLALSGSGCYSDPHTGTLYKIAEGDHYSTPRRVGTLKDSPLTFTAVFDSTAIYDSDGDLNKLYGFSDCNSLHHNNSARIGWRYYGDRLELWAYTYANGVRSMEYLTSAITGLPVLCSITKGDGFYSVCAGGVCKNVPRGNTCETGVYYLLYPYFGGDLPAPHDVYIQIKEI